MGETTADAPRPLLGTVENAIPRAVVQALPTIISQANRIHLETDVGISRPNMAAPKPIKSAICTTVETVTRIAFPIKYEAGDIGVPRKRFKVPKSRSIGMVIASCWNPEFTKPVAIIPATKY